jgi:hypothetical protein
MMKKDDIYSKEMNRLLITLAVLHTLFSYCGAILLTIGIAQVIVGGYDWWWIWAIAGTCVFISQVYSYKKKIVQEGEHREKIGKLKGKAEGWHEAVRQLRIND